MECHNLFIEKTQLTFLKRIYKLTKNKMYSLLS